MRLIENGEIIFHRIHKFHEVYIIRYVSFLHLFLCYDDKRGEADDSGSYHSRICGPHKFI